METIEALLANGRAKLEQKREEQRVAQEIKDQEIRMRNEQRTANLMSDLATLLPDELIPYVEIPEDWTQGHSRMRLVVPGCVPVHLNGYIWENGSIQNDMDFVLPAIITRKPSNDEFGFFEGEVIVTFDDPRRYDPEMGRTTLDDIELALAMAAERFAYVEQQKRCIEAEARPLRQEWAAMQAAQVPVKPREPVYTPLDQDDLPDEIINKPELIRFVRGVVSEALEERGL